MEEESYWAYLPEVCWELIIDCLREDENHNDHLAALSLVSKQFLSIASIFKTDLKVFHGTACILPGLLRRFQHLKSIEIVDDKDVDNVVHHISWSGLNHLEALKFPCNTKSLPQNFKELGTNVCIRKSLKKLDWPDMYLLDDSDLFAIVDLFPRLEELSVCGEITDAGIEVMASKLKESLKKISLNCFCITDQSLVSLSLNCTNLIEIHINGRDHQVTESGVGFVMRYSPNLTSLSLDSVKKRNIYDQPISNFPVFTIENSIAYARNLQVLSFNDSSDELLCSMAKQNPLPLKKIKLRLDRYNSTYHGLPILFQACHESLEELTVVQCHFSKELSQHLPIYLTSMDISDCYIYSNAFTFYTITKNCPLLQVLKMDWNEESYGDPENVPCTDIHQNSWMRHLSVVGNRWLNDDTIKIIGQVCPNLQFLFINLCNNLTSEGIGEVWKSFPAIMHLEIAYLRIPYVFGREYSEQFTVNLKTLEACGAEIDDESMAMIGKRCPYLQVLNIRQCQRITNNGLKEVVRNCKRLREINLLWCESVTLDILFWMVVTRPSLKKIIPPFGFAPRAPLAKLFLCFGCIVDNGEYEVDYWD